MADIGNAAHAGQANGRATMRAGRFGSGARGHALAPISAFSRADWQALAERATEPNAYYLPDWEQAVDATARGRGGVTALAARDDTRKLVALLPVVSAWRSLKISLPVLVSADPYGDLGTPLLDGDAPLDAAHAMLDAARATGARAIVLRHVTLEGKAMQAIRAALAEGGLAPLALRTEARACLDATRDSEELLREALGTKKLKELRRQRNRLAEHGEIAFTAARTPADVAAMVDVFLQLEASGWKGNRGTALAQHAGDTSFIRRATVALAENGQCEIVALHAGKEPVAAGVVLRLKDRAFWFKLGVDERFAKYSPGVQLALELTRYFCAEPQIAVVDSTALPGHPMIEPIWRGRLPIGDVVIPLKRNDPIVALTVAVLRARLRIRSKLRKVVQLLRTFKEKRQ